MLASTALTQHIKGLAIVHSSGKAIPVAMEYSIPTYMRTGGPASGASSSSDEYGQDMDTSVPNGKSQVFRFTLKDEAEMFPCSHDCQTIIVRIENQIWVSQGYR